jgi:hypothetical protein
MHLSPNPRNLRHGTVDYVSRGILKLLHSALGSARHAFADGGYQGQPVAVAKSASGRPILVAKMS